jgi:Fe-S cluster assembly protein SufD
VSIVVHRDGAPRRPIVLDHRGGAAHAGASVLSHVVRLEDNARATLVELYDERPAAAPRALLGELRIELAPGSQLTHLRLAAATHAPAHHVDTLVVEVGRDAQYEQRSLWAPQRALRSTQHLCLLGDGARAVVRGGAIARTGADVDLRVLVKHAADASHSEQTLHVLGAGGRATVDSEANVPRGRRAIRSRQSLRGVQLGARCDIALRPRLAILSQDVDCRHGATTAALAPDALFFLRSRGLALPEAQRLLAAAHLQQLLPPTGEAALDALVEAWLQAALHAAVAPPEACA